MMRLVYPPAAAAALREPSTTHEDEIPVERSNTAHDQASMRESECKDFREVPKSAGSGKRHRRVRGASRRQLALVHAEGATGIQRGNARYCAGCGSMIEKLAALVPAPRFNLVRYHGVFAPAAKWRADIVPSDPPSDSLSHRGCRRKAGMGDILTEAGCLVRGRARSGRAITRGLSFCTEVFRSM